MLKHAMSPRALSHDKKMSNRNLFELGMVRDMK